MALARKEHDWRVRKHLSTKALAYSYLYREV